MINTASLSVNLDSSSVSTDNGNSENKSAAISLFINIKLAIKEIESEGLIISHLFKAFCNKGKTVISKYISAGKLFISSL